MSAQLRRRALSGLICLASLSGATDQALAWGDQGHEIIALVADHFLEPAVRDTIAEDAYKRGLILLPCGEATLRYIPALNIPKDVLDAGLDVLEDVLRAVGARR